MPVPCFLLFLVSENLLRKYSRNWTKQKTSSIISRGDHGVQRGVGADPPGGHATLGRGPGWARAPPMAWWPPSATDAASSPIYSPRRENPITVDHIPRKVPSRPSSSISDRGSSDVLPAPCRRGNHHRRLLHHHACLRSDA